VSYGIEDMRFIDAEINTHVQTTVAYDILSLGKVILSSVLQTLYMNGSFEQLEEWCGIPHGQRVVYRIRKLYHFAKNP